MVVKSIDHGTSSLLPFDPATRKLVLEWTPSHLHVVLWNLQLNKPESVESFAGNIADEYEWQSVMNQSRLLHYNDMPLLAYCASGRAMPVPAALYDEATATRELNLLLGEAMWLRSFGDTVSNQNMIWFWQMPQAVASWLEEHFSSVTFRHSVGALLSIERNGDEPACDFIIDESATWALLLANGKLLQAAAFPLNNADDLAYRLLSMVKSSGLENHELLWRAGGMIETDAALYKGLEKYLKNLELRQTAHGLTDGVNAHYFAHLFEILS